MNMKHNIFNWMQNGMLKVAVCTLAFGWSSAVFAQSDDMEDDEVETTFKKPDRSKVKQVNYPTFELKGMVTDQSTGAPLAGVQVRAMGHDRYTTMSDEDGTFTIRLPKFVTSLYAYSVGYLSQQVAINAGDSTQTVTVKMLPDKFLQMYGTGTDYTARRTAQIDRFGVTVDNEIANKLGADVRSILHSGMQSVGASMFIRGLNSITCDAQPLIVIDGVEQDMQRNRGTLHTGEFNNLLANVAPDDIEKVTVLKNATALYGARGANGVVLIDTKRGHSMATRIDANISAGVQLMPQLPTVMNARQYRTYASELLGTVPDISDYTGFYFLNDQKEGNYYYYPYHNDTDWKDEVYRTALTQNYSINVQGGDDIGMYNLSVGYVDSKNTLKESNFNRMNVRFNTDIKILWNLKTRFDIAIARTNNRVYDDGMPADFDRYTVTSPTALALLKSPLLAPYEYNSVIGRFTNLKSEYDNILAASEYPRGGLIKTDNNRGLTYTSQSLANPLSILTNGEGDNKNKMENTFFNVHVQPVYEFSPALSLLADVSYTLNRNSQRYYRPYEGVPPFVVEEMGTTTSLVASMFAKEQNVVGKLQLNWKKQFADHAFNVFAGARYNYFSFDNSDLKSEYSAKGNDKNPELTTAGFPGVTGVNDVWKSIQWFGNVDYNYQNRYFATVSLTAEANSRFGENADGLGLFGVKWALFPSVQLGWVMTNEKWFPKQRGINYLRLNVGYDMSGNDNISNYAARTSFTSVKYYDRAMGIQLTNIGNDKIQWELTHKFNAGVQTYMLDNRLGVSFDYFYHKTNNLLTQRTFENPIGGITAYWSNGGELENQGFEVAVTAKPIVSKDWNLEMGLSVGHYKNKVTKLPEGFNPYASVYGDNNILTQVGQPVGVFYGYKTAGVFASDDDAKVGISTQENPEGYLYMEDDALQKNYFGAGDVHFLDLYEDGKIDEKDKIIIGDPNPDVYGNILATLGWKNLTLNIGFNYSLGNDVYNYQRAVLNFGSTFYNQQVAEVGRWRYEGQVAELPRAVFGDPMGNNRFSDRWIEDGSYLRLKTVNITYRVPVPGSWTWLQGLTIWAEAQNLLTFTRYKGCDPEFSVSNSVLGQGIDTGCLAQGRSFVAGLKINL